MAEPMDTGDILNVELREISSLKGRFGYFVRGKLLSVCDTRENLAAEKTLNESGRKMIETLGYVKSHHFQHMQVPFPVTNLQHVTEEESVRGICTQECFKVKQHDKRPEFNDLSFWSIYVSSDDIKTAHQEAYEAVRKVVTPVEAETYRGEIMEQFANSPAFSKSTSRYGNFRFSFPLSDLLSRYKSQHCGDGEPQIRILGTDLYKLEIAHYIVVHSPDTKKFNELPMVPSVHSNSDPLPFVYRKDGTLYWRPESTSNSLKVNISEYGSVLKECYQPCDIFTRNGSCCHDETYSVWNHLVFAFHLPEDHHLNIPRQDLLENLTACGGEEPFLGEMQSRWAAEKIIQSLKDEFNSDEGQ